MRSVIGPWLGLLLAACAGGRASAPPPEKPAPARLELREVRLQAKDADAFLAPGDFLFRYAGPDDPLLDALTGAVIRGGQSAIERVGEKIREERRRFVRGDAELSRALEKGDPNAVHVAIYLGRGENAEAFGTTPTDAAVGVWPLFAPARRGSGWRVFRHNSSRARRPGETGHGRRPATSPSRPTTPEARPPTRTCSAASSRWRCCRPLPRGRS